MSGVHVKIVSLDGQDVDGPEWITTEQGDHIPLGRPNTIMSVLLPCGRCGHSPDWHRHDDADNHAPTDPACPFRCIGYDCTTSGPVPPGGRACDCPNYVLVPS